MNRKSLFSIVGVAALVTAGSLVVAQQQNTTTKSDHGQAQGEMQLPPGWTEADMMACMEAGTPGEMHKHLANSVGTWNGQCKSWYAPNTEPMVSQCTSTVSTLMDGRYTQCKIEGEMPGMGPFSGLGLYGYDNTSEQFQSTWIDSHSTGMMRGTGDLSSDGKTLTWEFEYTCPITKKQTTMREVERYLSDNRMTLEMFGKDPKSGVEFKMMEINFTRQPKTAAAGTR